MRNTDPPTESNSPSGHPKPAGMTLVEMSHSNPQAKLAFLRLQLKQKPSSALLLKAAIAAEEATEWEEAAFYAKQLVLANKNLQAMEILANSLFELGRQADLDALWGQAAAFYLPVAADYSPVPSRPGEKDATEVPHRLSEPAGKLGMRLAQHLLKKGALKDGLRLRMTLRQFKKVMTHPLAREPSVPWWSETDTETPLLVLAEQALGEQILWSAAFNELSRRYPGSIVECKDRLIPIFTRSWPHLNFVSREISEITALATPGYRKIPGSELDYCLGTRIDKEIPAKWLKVDTKKSGEFRKKYQDLFPGSKLVGLSWRSHVPRYGSYKSLSLSDFKEVTNTGGFGFFSLQYGDISEDLRSTASQGITTPVIDAEVDAMADIDTWSAQVAAMDIVITTSNTTAHMAAALGVPTILVLPSRVSVLYYWGYDGRTTPWYSCIVDIVRGNGDIGEVMKEARAALERIIPLPSP